MELLDTVLRTCDGAKYVDNFVENSIDISTLQLLNEEDLKIIGIDDLNIRKKIIMKAKELQIPLEKRANINIDQNYIQQVLYQISNQLHLNNLNLLYGLIRDDIIIFDNQIHSGVLCLENCLTSLDDTVKRIEDKMAPVKGRKSKCKKLILLLTSTTLLLVCSKLYFTYRK